MERDEKILSYIQGRLSSEDVTAFEQEMTNDPALAAEVEVMQAARSTLADGPRHPNSDAVWARLSASIEGTPLAANDNRRPLVALLRYAAVAALAVGIWQVAVVPMTGNQNDGFRTASQGVQGQVLQVKFRGDATVAEISALLDPLSATISDGPSALGIFQLTFADEAGRDAARRALEQQQDLVEMVLDP